MGILHTLCFTLVTVAATGVVLTRDPVRQTIALSYYGISLGVLFFVFQAPDVALSQIAVGSVALPLLFMLALVHVKRDELKARRGQKSREAG